MARPKGSTAHSDSKIILALLYKPRRFSEFENALIEELARDLPDDFESIDPNSWKRIFRPWRLPRKTLARRLKALVAKGWVIKSRLPIHGRHVEYRLNFSKADEMLEELHLSEVHFTRSQIRFLKTVNAVVPLREEIPAIESFSHERVLEIYRRLRRGEFVCPKCLRKGKAEKALNVIHAPEGVCGTFYCRNCSEEVSLVECEEFLKELIRKEVDRKIHKAFSDGLRFFDAIERQLEKEDNKVD